MLVVSLPRFFSFKKAAEWFEHGITPVVYTCDAPRPLIASFRFSSGKSTMVVKLLREPSFRRTRSSGAPPDNGRWGQLPEPDLQKYEPRKGER